MSNSGTQESIVAQLCDFSTVAGEQIVQALQGIFPEPAGKYLIFPRFFFSWVYLKLVAKHSLFNVGDLGLCALKCH